MLPCAVQYKAFVSLYFEKLDQVYFEKFLVLQVPIYWIILIKVAIAVLLSFEVFNTKDCSKLEFILLFLVRPSLFRKQYSKQFRVTSKILISFISIEQKCNFTYDMEVLLYISVEMISCSYDFMLQNQENLKWEIKRMLVTILLMSLCYKMKLHGKGLFLYAL